MEDTLKVSYDLHIHTSLSPCADNDMTPNNIVNMNILKGLDVIAVTDHNSCRNVQACITCANNTPLLVIPGMEVETAEEIHVICLFRDFDSALEMQELVYSRLPAIKNRENIFGEQLVLDAEDQLVAKEDRLLLTSTSITINEVFEKVNGKLKGLAIPAHIDRQANSVLASLGAIPEDIDIRCVEISNPDIEKCLTEKHPGLKNIRKVYSSDAHYLGNINERKNYIEVDGLTVENVLAALGRN